jgi:hypothetical protein
MASAGVLVVDGMEREHHRDARHVVAIVNVDLARVQAPLELLAAHAQALARLFIDATAFTAACML